MNALYLTLIPIFAVLDRWCGGGMGWRSTFIGRPLYYVVALIPAALLLDWRLGVILTGWCIWRAPGWKLFGGSLAPKGGREIVGTFNRHLLILSVALAAQGQPLVAQIIVIGMLAVWAAFATHFAVWNRLEADKGVDANAYVELSRGAIFGWPAIIILGVLEAAK